MKKPVRYADKGVKEYFGIKETPAAILYKDGKEVKKVEGKNEGGMQDMATLLA